MSAYFTKYFLYCSNNDIIIHVGTIMYTVYRVTSMSILGILFLIFLKSEKVVSKTLNYLPNVIIIRINIKHIIM